MDYLISKEQAITILRNLRAWLYFSGINGGTKILMWQLRQLRSRFKQKSPSSGVLTARNMTKKLTVAIDSRR